MEKLKRIWREWPQKYPNLPLYLAIIAFAAAIAVPFITRPH